MNAGDDCPPTSGSLLLFTGIRLFSGGAPCQVVCAFARLVLVRERLQDLARLLKLAQVVLRAGALALDAWRAVRARPPAHLEHCVLLVVVQEGFAAHELVVLRQAAREQVANAARAQGHLSWRVPSISSSDARPAAPGMVCEHKAAHAVGRLHVW